MAVSLEDLEKELDGAKHGSVDTSISSQDLAFIRQRIRNEWLVEFRSQKEAAVVSKEIGDGESAARHFELAARALKAIQVIDKRIESSVED